MTASGGLGRSARGFAASSWLPPDVFAATARHARSAFAKNCPRSRVWLSSVFLPLDGQSRRAASSQSRVRTSWAPSTNDFADFEGRLGERRGSGRKTTERAEPGPKTEVTERAGYDGFDALTEHDPYALAEPDPNAQAEPDPNAQAEPDDPDATAEPKKKRWRGSSRNWKRKLGVLAPEEPRAQRPTKKKPKRSTEIKPGRLKWPNEVRQLWLAEAREKWEEEKKHLPAEQAALDNTLTKQFFFYARERYNAVWALYKGLGSGSMRDLHPVIRHRLLAVMGNPEKKVASALLRYFALLEELRACKIPITRQQYNYALALAAGYVDTIKHEEWVNCMTIWKSFEESTEIRGNEFTFNILFNVATKAGLYDMAQNILQEIETRKLPLDRYYDVSLMFFHGVMGDLPGLLRAYQGMVDAREMIDIVALNCLLTGILRCGETAQALDIYAYMKELHSRSLVWDHYFDRVMQKRLMKSFSRMAKSSPSMHRHFQNQVVVKPNKKTFQILIDHFAINKGDWDTTSSIIRDMAHFRIATHGRVFLALFKAFARFGRLPDTQWTEDRFHRVLGAFLTAAEKDKRARRRSSASDGVDEYRADMDGVYVGRWTVVWAVWAVTGIRDTSDIVVMDAYHSLMHLGDFDEDDRASLEKFVLDTIQDETSQRRWPLLESLCK